MDDISKLDLTEATRADVEYFLARLDQGVRASQLLIVRAKEGSLPAINALIARSKAYGSWPPEYLEQARVLHRIDADYLGGHHSFEVLDRRNELLSFSALDANEDRVVLDNLWVTPERIGHGIGRRACEYVFQFARNTNGPNSG